MLKYESIKEIVEAAENAGKKISEIVLADQVASMDRDENSVYEDMERAFDIMVESTHVGMDENLRSSSGLTGGEGARVLSYGQRAQGGFAGAFFTNVIARAAATSNCNAAMGRIVATPTAGSCGILPGVLVTLLEDEGYAKHDLVMSLFTAAAFGIVIATKASISGAAGGCQAECGSAAGMAAASMVEILGGSPQQAADAMGMAIMNQLGLVCDPVATLVEVPCIGRNAGGAAVALTATTMAMAGCPLVIPPDECILAMKRVGDQLDDSLKETAEGGLAATPTAKRIQKEIFGKLPEVL